MSEQSDQNTTTTADDGGQVTQEPTFTQEQLDAILAKRLGRAEETAVNKLLQELGLESVEDLRGAVDERQMLKDAQMSDAEKQAAQIEQLQQRVTDAEAKAQAATEAAKKRLMKAAVLVEASKQGFSDAADAWSFIDQTAVEIGEDGEFVGVDKAVEAVATAKPYLIKSPVTRPQGSPRLSRNGKRPSQPAKPLRPTVNF